MHVLPKTLHGKTLTVSICWSKQLLHTDIVQSLAHSVIMICIRNGSSDFYGEGWRNQAEEIFFMTGGTFVIIVSMVQDKETCCPY